MRRHRPPTLPGRLPPPPGGRDPHSLDCRNNGGAARRGRSPATVKTTMPDIDISALFIGQEDREGDDGSSVATEDDDYTDVEAGGYACLGRAFREEEDDIEDDRDKQGRRERRRRRDSVDVRDTL